MAQVAALKSTAVLLGRDRGSRGVQIGDPYLVNGRKKSDLQTTGIFIITLVLLMVMRFRIGIALWTMANWNNAWGSLGILLYAFASCWVLISIPA